MPTRISQDKCKKMVWKRNRDLKKGDLVYHVLYGRDFRAIVIESEEIPEDARGKQRTMIHVVPGTRYQNYFDRVPSQNRVGKYCGWVSTHWLIKVC